MARGTVYLATNLYLDGLVKIGRTQGDVRKRMKHLSGTNIPAPYECTFAVEVDDCKGLEESLHIIFGPHREKANREFFRMDPGLAIEALRLIPNLKEVTPDADNATAPEDTPDLQRARQSSIDHKNIDCLIVTNNAAKFQSGDTFDDLFINQKRWYQFRMAEPYRKAVKYIAVYQAKPDQVVTHIGHVAHFEPSPTGDTGNWQAVFQSTPEVLLRPVPLGDNASNGLMQSPRYCNRDALVNVASLSELFGDSA